MRSGYINNNGGGLRYPGQYGHYWSSMLESSTGGAHFLYFSGSDVGPSGDNVYHWLGYPLRCLAS